MKQIVKHFLENNTKNIYDNLEHTTINTNSYKNKLFKDMCSRVIIKARREFKV